MAGNTQIHQGKQPVRKHYIAEWAEVRGMDAMDLLNAINEAASMDQPVIDKSQVYRWFAGQLPRPATQIRIAAALQLLDPETGAPDPELLLTHPDYEWFARKTRGRSRQDIERMKGMIDLAFPPTGTDN